MELNDNTIIGICYLISVPYVTWKLVKRLNQTSLDGVIGASTGWEFFFLLAAPIWMALDLIITGIIKLKQRITRNSSHR